MNLGSLYGLTPYHGIFFSLGLSLILTGSIVRRYVEIRLLAKQSVKTAVPSEKGAHPLYSFLAMIPLKIFGYLTLMSSIALGVAVENSRLWMLYAVIMGVLIITPGEIKSRPEYSESSKLEAPSDRIRYLRWTVLLAIMFFFIVEFVDDVKMNMFVYILTIATLIAEYLFYRKVEIPFWMSKGYDLVKGAFVTKRPTTN